MKSLNIVAATDKFVYSLRKLYTKFITRTIGKYAVVGAVRSVENRISIDALEAMRSDEEELDNE